MGRPKGASNKSTKAVKEALQEAFDGLGGVPSLVEWAKSEPTEFYKLWTKLIPTEVKAELTGADGGPIKGLNVTFVDSATK